MIKYIICFYTLILHILFAEIPKIPQITIPNASMPHMPSIQAPKEPTMPTINMPNAPTQNNTTKNVATTTILQNLITDVIRHRMLLSSACIPEKIALQSKLNAKEVQQLGVQLQLTTSQYQDNLLRLRNLILKPANATMQKQFLLTQQGELVGVLIVITFSIKNTQQHSIALSSDYLQIDNMLLESTPQIFSIFQTYFCHAYTLKG